MATISYEYLFQLRLVVARYGEMDHMRWWNTNGILGKYGSLTLSRGFPKTHRFAQAKVAFSVAAQRCQEIYDPPHAYTLWNLPPEIEDQFQEHWHKWLDSLDHWEGFFKNIEEIAGKELLGLFENCDLITPGQIEDAKNLRRSAEGRSVQVSGVSELNDDALAMLAAGFFRGEQGKPAIPYVNVAAREKSVRLVDGNRVVRVSVSAFFSGGVETGEQLDAALQGLKETCERHIGAGKKVLIQ